MSTFADVQSIVPFLASETYSNLTNETQQSAFIRMAHTQRLGQAFMNVLDEDSYNTLTGSLFDPFYKDDAESIIRAIDFLTR